ncbi:MAG: phospholipase D family protein [Lysobacteraceae bacterium]
MTAWPLMRLGIVVLAALLLAACMPSARDIREAQAAVAEVRPSAVECTREDRCAIASPLRELALRTMAAASAEAPRHQAMLLEYGQDALLARVHMIRAAQRSVDLQSFIYAEDDSGFLMLEELLAAARRGVKVRVLLDQLFSLEDLSLLAALARAHVNFEIRLYNPTFGDARTQPLEFLAGIVCCFTRFNQRMHNKLLQIDGLVAITGGRNVQNRYFDWDPGYNYRDRDLLLAGPEVAAMVDSFDDFWLHPLSVPVAALHDVRKHLRDNPAGGPPRLGAKLTVSERILDLSAQADSALVITRRLIEPSMTVGRVEFLSDRPNKPFERNDEDERDLGRQLSGLLAGAQEEVILQTPYLVLSRHARREFRQLQQREEPPQVIVSTNSLAATDAFPVYALSHKYKRRYLRELGFHIYEYKPFPASAPIDLDAAGVIGDGVLGAHASESHRAFGSSGSARRGPLPLREVGMRIGLHSKSLVIDRRIGIVGTHNFDPRSDHLNTESLVLVHDAVFAERLRRHVLHDILPENSWTIARRPDAPILSALNYQLAKATERLPLFDLWPWRYATSWEILPGCAPLPPDHPDFRDCYEPVGDFPEVEYPTKSIYTRILTAFGAGLAPIL